MIEAGQLSRRVTIQELVLPPDALERGKAEYKDIATVWAKIETQGGNETQIAEQTVAVATHQITIRWANDLAHLSPGTHRLIYGDRVFGIERVNNVDEGNHTFELTCIEAK